MKQARFLTGYIEGYYGRFLTWEQRAELVRKLAQGGGGIFLIASKEDPFHRQEWRKPYPRAWMNSLKALVRFARSFGVEIIPGMAPGLSFDYTSKTDYSVLVRKFKAFQAAGCQQLALLMDDIPAILPTKAKGTFQSLGEAHGHLLTQLAKDLKLGEEGAPIWFCPTIYCDQFSGVGVATDPYLKDLAKLAPKGSPIFWTGKTIVPRKISQADLQPLHRLFPNRVVLWDNLYAHDYCPWKLFLGPYLGRPHSIRKVLKGVLLNPTGMLATDCLYMDQLHAWARQEGAIAAWKKALQTAHVPKPLTSLIRYLYLPQEPWKAALYSSKSLAKARKVLKPFIWNWKSELQREWYPFLFMLDADLRVAEQGLSNPAGSSLDAEWVRKRYTPVMAQSLLARTPKTTLPQDLKS